MNDRDDDRISTADVAGTTAADEQRGAPEQAERREFEHDDDEGADGLTAGTESRPSADDDELTPLFPADRSEEYRDRWRTVQTNFVDDPRKAVEEADGLVAQVIKELAQSFADERSGLEQQWGRGEDVSTEDLRVALRRYRSFFERLLSV